MDTSDAIALNPLPALMIARGTGAIVQWNDHAADLFGTDIRHRGRIADLLDSPSSEFAVFLEAVCHYGRYVDAFLRFTRADGTALRVQTFGSCHADGDGPIMLTFLDLDVQARRTAQDEETAHYRAGLMHWKEIYGFFQELEANNRLILEAAGEGIYGINAEGKATFINRAAQEMLGWSAEDLIGRDLHSTIHHSHLDGSHFPAHTCPIYDSFRRDKTMRVDDDAFWRKDGRPIQVEYVSTPIYDHGVLAGAVIIFRDVTERREGERRLREALAEVETLRHELEQENAYLLTEIRGARRRSGMVGVSPAIRTLSAQIDLVAETATNVLVSGPPGSGKSLVVDALHEGSDRRRRPLVRVACSDGSADDLARDLFGYRRDAVPGARRDSVGKIALAANGTLHLDEVSELPRIVQSQLFDVLQQRGYRRIGDLETRPVDLRIVSTTTRDLAAEVEAGRFRQDLYFALSVLPMRCEPLRSRPEDIPYLAHHFLEVSTRRLRLPQMTLTKANVDALQRHDWSGNVRELENVVERAAILAVGGKLSFEFEQARVDASDEVLTDREIKRLERENLMRSLRRAKGKVAGPRGAARLLGLPPTTVYSRMKALNVTGVEK